MLPIIPSSFMKWKKEMSSLRFSAIECIGEFIKPHLSRLKKEELSFPGKRKWEKEHEDIYVYTSWIEFYFNMVYSYRFRMHYTFFLKGREGNVNDRQKGVGKFFYPWNKWTTSLVDKNPTAYNFTMMDWHYSKAVTKFSQNRERYSKSNDGKKIFINIAFRFGK